MAYWMLDDQAPQKGKIKALTAPALEGDIEGLAAIGMWALAGATSQARGSDGLVTLADLVGLVPDRAIAERLAHRLVDAGLFHGHGHDCPRCDPVGAVHSCDLAGPQTGEGSEVDHEALAGVSALAGIDEHAFGCGAWPAARHPDGGQRSSWVSSDVLMPEAPPIEPADRHRSDFRAAGPHSGHPSSRSSCSVVADHGPHSIRSATQFR
jgi:hypothetical protein